MSKYFAYGDEEINYLKKKDARLAAVIERLGHIERTVDEDLFSAVLHHIIGQQISAKAQKTVWVRLQNLCGRIEPEQIASFKAEAVQSCGMSRRKAEYIIDFAQKVTDGSFDLAKVAAADDEEAIALLSSLKGIGKWTAEMILLFCLQRQDVFSYDDLAIQRGLRMIYRHRKIDKKLFDRYRRRFSPYGSVASFYIWAVAGGALPELTDPAFPPQNAKCAKEDERISMYFYDSPVGVLKLSAQNGFLVQLSFSDDTNGQNEIAAKDKKVLSSACRWLDIYFSGGRPDFLPPMHLEGTPFRRAVWKLLQQIPYGRTASYSDIARQIAARQGRAKMSAQAVGGAVGANPIAIIVPCHRVIGRSGSLTGYAGGLDKKIALLEIEGHDMKKFSLPK